MHSNRRSAPPRSWPRSRAIALMCELDGRYPNYGFAQHKGYATPSTWPRSIASGRAANIAAASRRCASSTSSWCSSRHKSRACQACSAAAGRLGLRLHRSFAINVPEVRPSPHPQRLLAGRFDHTPARQTRIRGSGQGAAAELDQPRSRAGLARAGPDRPGQPVRPGEVLSRRRSQRHQADRRGGLADRQFRRGAAALRA